MSMQPVARWPGTKPTFLAQHEPSPVHGAVPGPHPKHAGWPGKARNLVRGPMETRNQPSLLRVHQPPFPNPNSLSPIHRSTPLRAAVPHSLIASHEGSNALTPPLSPNAVRTPLPLLASGVAPPSPRATP